MSPMTYTPAPTAVMSVTSPEATNYPYAPSQLNKPSKNPRHTNDLESFLLSNRPSYQARVAARRNPKPAATLTITEGERRRRFEAKRAERNERLEMTARIAREQAKPQVKPRNKLFVQQERERREAANIEAAEAKAANMRLQMRPGIPLADQLRGQQKAREAKKDEAYNQRIVTTSEKAKQVTALAAERAERRRLTLQRVDGERWAEQEAEREARRQESAWKTQLPEY
ncbi:hypothetical protein PspLS_02269 [Pyricularia sp. CBS 133598]|nr:hypothetical protein PspLS_02269 [Pyricularia sp. CBS 133598]